MTPLIMQCYPASRHFLPLWSRRNNRQRFVCLN